MARHKEPSKAPSRPSRDTTATRATPVDAEPANRILSAAQTRFLRGQAHGLKALLQVGGKGVSEGVIAEAAQALEDHELIKVKVAGADREERNAMIDALVEGTGAALVQRIGHTAVLFRQSREKRQVILPRA